MGAQASGLNGARRRRGAIRAVAALAAAAALAGCAQPRAPESAPVAQAPSASAPSAPQPGEGGRVALSAPAPVTLLLPLSAESRPVRTAARDMADAARLALADRPGLVRLEVRDTGGTPGRAAAAARDAAGRGAALILGPLYGRNAESAGEAVAADGLNLISLSNTPSVAGGNVWLIGRMARTQTDRILGHAAQEGRRRVGLYYPDTAAGEEAREAAEAAAERLRLRLAPVMAYPRSFEGIQDTARSYAEAHKAAGAQAALLPDSGQGLVSAASFLRYHDVGAQNGLLLGLASWGAPGMERESSMVGGRFAAPEPERFAAFAQRFEAAYGRKPAELSWLGHDAAAAAAEMMVRARRAEDERPFGAEDITDPGGFRGAAGPFRFTADGLNRRALAVVEMGRDGLVVLEPAPGAAAPAEPGV
ncbi:MAG: ABC transporter substrate-binding protein [Pseudomonadota bacterium]